MKELSVSEFKAHCLDVLRHVQETEATVLITEHGRPIAEIRPARETRTRSPVGLMRGRGAILGDVVGPVPPDTSWESLG